MSEEVTTQTATENANDPAKPGSEATNGAPADTNDDLETALNEYDAANEGSSNGQTQTTTPAGTETAEQRLARLEKQEADRQRSEAERVYKADLASAVASIRGEFTADEVADETIEAWLEGRARNDPRVAQAWMKRGNDTAKYKRVLNALQNEFAQKHARLRNVDRDTTETTVVVADAVRRASNKAPEGKAPDFTKLSDAEYREKVRKEYGFNPL
jgi:hypothetical protein